MCERVQEGATGAVAASEFDIRLDLTETHVFGRVVVYHLLTKFVSYKFRKSKLKKIIWQMYESKFLKVIYLVWMGVKFLEINFNYLRCIITIVHFSVFSKKRYKHA